jgi:choline dehydrogenase
MDMRQADQAEASARCDEPERAYDYIIVGGGPAGCVLARRLIERTAATVLLIEAGPPDTGVEAIHDPARWVSLLRGPYDWGYDYAPSPHVNGRVIGIPRGRVLGGSSSINAMVWYRGHACDYDAWETVGAHGWNFSTLLPYFKRAEDWECGETEYRGAGGPLRIERPRDPHPLALALIEAATGLGIPMIDDFNGSSNEGVTRPNLNVGGGRRWSAARGYLAPLLAHPRLTVLTHSTVRRLDFAHGRCLSVTHVVGGRQITTRAASEVLLCAGAINSPHLLMLSGIGDATDLRALGIPVVAAVPGVGRNLQDHPLLQGVNFLATTPLGPIRDNGGGAVLNWKSRSAGVAPDLHAFVVQGVHAVPEIAKAYKLGPDCFAISPGLMRSKSRGYLRLHSANPEARPEIQPNFLQEPDDLEALAEALEWCMDLAAAPAFAALASGLAAPDRRLSRAERIAFVRNACSTFFHTCGTCAMGTDEQAVVDPDLKVRGVDGLRVVDASVIPIIPSCNTNAPVIMIAERAADIIVGHGVRLPAELYYAGT